jgi:hypothetical protein
MSPEYFALVKRIVAQQIVYSLGFSPIRTAIERWFAEITNKRIRRESWESVTQLKKAIKEFIQNWNASGRSFKWTKEPEEILVKIQKARKGTLV